MVSLRGIKTPGWLMRASPVVARPKRMVSLRGIKTISISARHPNSVESEEDGFPKRD